MAPNNCSCRSHFRLQCGCGANFCRAPGYIPGSSAEFFEGRVPGTCAWEVWDQLPEGTMQVYHQVVKGFHAPGSGNQNHFREPVSSGRVPCVLEVWKVPAVCG